ncbi:MAG: Ribosomal protein L11 methyltransferase [Opitutia bacterium UBA7350]|nr:MAG: Ribosomal protein L11 methyltransferase [Opitutae bacterium UBA7350]
MSTQWELRAVIPAKLADALEAHCYELDASPWGISQKEPQDPFELFGFFPNASAADSALMNLRAVFKELPDDFELQEIADANWQNAYKAFVKPWSDRILHWIPLWERETTQAPKGAAVVYLEAGMAFGTGSHETTRLCARRLIDFLELRPTDLETAQVVDAGCGSGVLALSAAALGFKQIEAFDVDPEVLAVCQNNNRENPHLPSLNYTVGDLDSGLNHKQADLLLANIQADVLMPAAKNLLQALRPGATLALSGILVQEIEAVRAHFQNACHTHFQNKFRIESRTDGEWADLCLMLD